MYTNYSKRCSEGREEKEAVKKNVLSHRLPKNLAASTTCEI